MPAQPKILKRVFHYKGMELPDPNPQLPPPKCLEILAGQFPELINAKVEPPSEEGGLQTFQLRVSAEVKG
jgi:PRTRC genetic system protein C